MFGPTIIRLGDFIFQDFEVPEQISAGGAQQLSVKKLIGGLRVIDAMGDDPSAIEWSGQFFATLFESASDRCLLLEQIKAAGKAVVLSWDSFRYAVIIKGFTYDLRFQRIPYKISCEVLADLTKQPISNPFQDIASILMADVNYAITIAAAINSASISGSLLSLGLQMGAVASYDNAPLSVIAPIVQTVSAIMVAIKAESAANDTVIASASAPGGVTPGVASASNLAAFEAQLAATNAQTGLMQVQALMGRTLKNLQQVNSSQQTVTVGGGNLYDLAAKYYGDATAWTLIAQANGLTDPQITGIATLIIPPYNAASAGVLMV